jgi:hypothetical protein
MCLQFLKVRPCIIQSRVKCGINLLTCDWTTWGFLLRLWDTRSGLLVTLLLLTLASKHLRLQMRGLLLRELLLRGWLLLRRRLLTPLALALLDRRRVLTWNPHPRPQPLKG